VIGSELSPQSPLDIYVRSRIIQMMTRERKNRKKELHGSYEETIARAEHLTEEERMRLARKVLLAAVQSAPAKK